MNLYHFSDSAHLPWILRSGHLRPGQNLIGEFPEEFLWATANRHGDPTATASFGDLYKSGAIFLIRFTLNEGGFFPWSKVEDFRPAWTPAHVATIERAARGAKTVDWWCRCEPLELEDVLSIEARSYSDNRWREADRVVEEVNEQGKKWLGTSFNGRRYFSARHINENGTNGYTVGSAR
jgi:hypothetical protein